MAPGRQVCYATVHSSALELDMKKLLSQKTITKIIAAFDAMVIVVRWGQPCYRTANDVPMSMPKDVEKKVRAALKALGRKHEKGE